MTPSKTDTKAPETPAAPAQTTFAGFVAVPKDKVATKARAGASLPASALEAVQAIHAATIGTASDFFAVPGDDEKARQKWLRGLRAAATDLRHKGDDGAEMYPHGRRLIVGEAEGAPVWSLGGAAKERKPWDKNAAAARKAEREAKAAAEAAAAEAPATK